MKNTFVLIAALFILCLSAGNVAAQDKQKAKISLLKQEGKTVTLTVTSNNEFYMGGNMHILHIGDMDFKLYDQDNIDGKGYLKFFIPVNDYKALKDGTKVYLSYGELSLEPGQNIEELCSQKFCPCWSLGKLNKKSMK